MPKNLDLSLYLITERYDYTMDEFLSIIEDAIKGGVTIVQVREKNASTRELIEIASEVHKITKKYNIPLIIDDRVDVVLAISAEGVHLGSEDMDIKLARKILGKDAIIGATAKTKETAMLAENNGADYLGVGAIYPTTTKVITKITKVETLKEIKENVNIPVAAIGGLNKDNLDVLKNSKCNGICVVSALMKSKSAFEDAKEMKERFKSL